MEQKRFEEKIKPILNYVGTIGAILMAIAYMAIVFIMVFGFSIQQTLSQTLGFSLVNAVMGLIIMQFLKVQGIDLAKNLPNNQALLQKYQQTKTKDKVNHSINYFWVTSVIKDVLVKGVGIAATTIGIIYIVIQGSNNYTLLLLAAVNIIMFACFGLLNLVKAYDFFNEQHIPHIMEVLNHEEQQKQYILEQEAKAREEAIEREIERRVDMAKKELIKQRDNMVCANRGSDILDSSMGSRTYCYSDGECVVVDDTNGSNSFLGWSDNTCDTASNCFNPIVEENSSKDIKSEETEE